MSLSIFSLIPGKYQGYIYAISGAIAIFVFIITWYNKRKEGDSHKTESYSGIVGAKSGYGISGGGSSLLIDGEWRRYPIYLATKLDKYVDIGDSAYKVPNEWKVIIYKKDSLGNFEDITYDDSSY